MLPSPGRPALEPADAPPPPELPRQPARLLVAVDLPARCSALSLFAELIANDRPLLVRYDGAFYFPIVRTYPETTFGGDFPTEAVYRDPAVGALIQEKGWMLWPPIPFRYDTINYDLPVPAPAAALPGELARHRRPGARRHGPADLRLPHLGAVRPHADPAELGHRRRRRRGAGLLRRPGSTSCSSASSRSGRACRCSTC